MEDYNKNTICELQSTYLIQENEINLDKINFDELLTDARSISKEKRDYAEKILNEISSNRHATFLLKLAESISCEKYKNENRQLACYLIKNKIILGKENLILWYSIDENSKNLIKMNLMATLGSGSNIIKRAVGVLISVICKVEIPNGNWIDIIDTLTHIAINNQNEINVMSALETLSFISEELSSLDQEKKGTLLFIINSRIDEILNAIFNKIKSYTSICVISLKVIEKCLKCFSNVIPLAINNFNNEAEKFSIFEILLNLAEKCLKFGQKEILEIICQNIITICQYYYFNLENVLEKIMKLTQLIHSLDYQENERVILFSLEIWCLLSDKELEYSNVYSVSDQKRTQRYIQVQAGNLFKILIDNLEKINNETMTDWNISRASAYIMCILVQLSNSEYTEKLLVYSENNFHSEKENKRYASIIALSCCLETVHKDKISNLLKYNFSNFIKSIADKSDIVSNANSWLLCKISEIFPYIIDKQLFSTYIPLFMKIIKIGMDDNFFFNHSDSSYSTEDLILNKIQQKLYSNQVRVNLSIFIMNIIKFYGDKYYTKNTNSITPYYMKLLDNCIYTGFNIENFLDKNFNLSTYSFYMISNIIEYSSLDFQDFLEIILKTILDLLGKINQDVNCINNVNLSNLNFIPNFSNKSFIYSVNKLKDFLHFLQENCCKLIEKIFKKIVKKVNDNLCHLSYKLIIDSFNLRNSTYDNGLTCISYIAISNYKIFTKFRPQRRIRSLFR